jgi:nucleotide-binding universal stress UspA family protein
MFKIIVPVDFSEPSIVAAKYAIKLVEALNIASVTLLHCITPEATPAMEHKLEDILLHEAENDLKLLLNTISNGIHVGIHFEYDVLFGDVPQSILKKIESEKPELVVMGTRGAGGFQKFFIGSNTSDVVDENMTCPTLVVPSDTQMIVPKKIMYATDLKDCVSETPVVAAFAKLFNAHIDVVHVTDDEHEPNSESTDQKSYELGKQCNYFEISYKSFIHPDIPEGIEKYIRESGVDMVAMFSRRKTVFEKWFDRGLTREMSYHSKVPLLAVPYDLILK